MGYQVIRTTYFLLGQNLSILTRVTVAFSVREFGDKVSRVQFKLRILTATHGGRVDSRCLDAFVDAVVGYTMGGESLSLMHGVSYNEVTS